LFTGITRGLFSVTQVASAPDLIDYVVDLGQLADGLTIGASVAVDGVCQTAVSITGSLVRFQAIRETLARTTLDTLRVGRLVSIERSRKVGDEIGGHDVAGHVIGTGTITVRKVDGDDVALCVSVPTPWMKYLLHKGFVALDGSSLTLGEVYPTGTFWVHLIPETLRVTGFFHRHQGDRVNVELDSHTVSIVDTVERVLAQRGLHTG
jgi:riboflavin synthase